MSFINFIIRPFTIIKNIVLIFLIYLGATIFLGQLGIWARIILNPNITHLTWIDILIREFNSGSFYLFSIALIAARVTQYFIDLTNEEQNYKNYKVTLLFISILFIILMTLLYANIQILDFQQIQNKETNISLDYTQLIWYISSLVLSVYMFCVGYLHTDPESYTAYEDQNLMRTKKSAKNINKDDQGIKL